MCDYSLHNLAALPPRSVTSCFRHASLTRLSAGSLRLAAARQVCELEAASAEAVIIRAIREFGIDDPHKQKGLAAYRVTP